MCESLAGLQAGGRGDGGLAHTQNTHIKRPDNAKSFYQIYVHSMKCN